MWGKDMFYLKVIAGIIVCGFMALVVIFSIAAIYLNLFEEISEDNYEEELNDKNKSNSED